MKGLIVGAITGAATGLGLEGIERTGRHVTKAVGTIGNRLPDAVDTATTTLTKAATTISETAPDMALQPQRTRAVTDHTAN